MLVHILIFRLRKLVRLMRRRPAYAAATVMALAGGLFIWHSLAAVNTAAADLNGDSVVNLTDLSMLLANYGKSSSGLKGDLNADGTVNLTDLSLLLTNYGK